MSIYSQSQQTFQERGKKDILRFPSFSPPSLSLMYNESVEAICKTSIKAFHASFPLCFVYLSKTVVFTFVSQNMGVQIYVQYFLNHLFIYLFIFALEQFFFFPLTLCNQKLTTNFSHSKAHSFYPFFSIRNYTVYPYNCIKKPVFILNKTNCAPKTKISRCSFNF